MQPSPHTVAPSKICLHCGIELKREMFKDGWQFKRAKYCSKGCYLNRHKMQMEERMCQCCSNYFIIRAALPTKTCSKECSYEIRKIYGGSYITFQGYVAIKTHSEFSDPNGYELEHRLVMRNHLNRPLTSEEHVHHKDGNKTNNDISNLEILSNSEHQILHNSQARLNQR